MDNEIPIEIRDYFTSEHSHLFPFLQIPQSFNDDRGYIKNIADGLIGDVALIHTKPGAVRANHFHKEDWHLTFLLSGEAKYLSSQLQNGKPNSLREYQVVEGSLLFTPALVWHRFEFIKASTMIVISRRSRTQENYEADTHRLNEVS